MNLNQQLKHQQKNQLNKLAKIYFFFIFYYIQTKMDDQIIITRGDQQVVLTEERLKDLTSKFLECAADQAATYDDFNMNIKMVDLLLKTKTTWYPATQKNLNMNVENFDTKLKLWLDARKEMQKEKELTVTVE